MDLARFFYVSSSFAKQNQGDAWPRFQSLLKLLLWKKVTEWVKVLNVLGTLCLWQCFCMSAASTISMLPIHISRDISSRSSLNVLLTAIQRLRILYRLPALPNRRKQSAEIRLFLHLLQNLPPLSFRWMEDPANGHKCHIFEHFQGHQPQPLHQSVATTLTPLRLIVCFYSINFFWWTIFHVQVNCSLLSTKDFKFDD